jgi:hypothetical protein
VYTLRIVLKINSAKRLYSICIVWAQHLPVCWVLWTFFCEEAERAKCLCMRISSLCVCVLWQQRSSAAAIPEINARAHLRCNGFITAAHKRKGKSYSNSSFFHTGAKRVRGLRVRSVAEVGVAPAPGFSRDCLSLGYLPARAPWLREPRMSGEAGYLSCFSTGSSGALHLLNWQRPGCHNT